MKVSIRKNYFNMVKKAVKKKVCFDQTSPMTRIAPRYPICFCKSALNLGRLYIIDPLYIHIIRRNLEEKHASQIFDQNDIIWFDRQLASSAIVEHKSEIQLLL